MQTVGRALRAANVRVIYLVHGSFVGADALGLLREVNRFWPAAGDSLGQLQKQLLDSVAKDAGNYAIEFAEAFRQAIALSGQADIPIRLFHWSSENHHIGRADGAVRLLGTLFDDDVVHDAAVSDGKVLIWSHSHGGNVLALLTNLIGGDPSSRSQFFNACRSYYSISAFNFVDVPEWPRVSSLLDTSEARSLCDKIDLVTFGTPVRYGWETNACGNLLHFIHHRPVPDHDPTVAQFPFSADDALHAKYGDYIQQLGIAGTNFPPAVWSVRAGRADRMLGRLVQPHLRTRDLYERLKAGTRTHEDGTNLLVDYGEPEGHVGQHVAGHAVYTRLDWLLFHAEEVARRFYNLPG